MEKINEQKKLDFKSIEEIKRFKERIEKERQERLSTSGAPLEFGISFLDDCLGGIYPSDLILIGSKTGIGKTELVAQIAQRNAEIGKRVYFFALEASPFEIERRIKYKLLSQVFHEVLKKDFPKIHMDFQDWATGKLDADLGKFEPEIEALLAEKYDSLFTFYRGFGDYTVQDFEKQILAIQDNVDLIVVDHAHYFDSENENENQALKEVIKKIRDLSLLVGKPIILVAHLRKSDRKYSTPIPDVEDFHGSSDLVKICTKAILIAPGEFDPSNKVIFPTYFKIAKNRVAGNRTRYLASLSFDVRTNQYSKAYLLGNWKGGQFEQITAAETPYWAKQSKNISIAHSIVKRGDEYLYD